PRTEAVALAEIGGGPDGGEAVRVDEVDRTTGNSLRVNAAQVHRPGIEDAHLHQTGLGEDRDVAEARLGAASEPDRRIEDRARTRRGDHSPALELTRGDLRTRGGL